MNERWLSGRSAWAWGSNLALGLAIGLFHVGPLAAQTLPGSVQERGKVVYDQHCAVCHGAQGRADTPVGRLLKPRPRNFSDPIEMARVSADRAYRAIKEGRTGTAMSAWRQVLTEMEVGDVIDYIRSLTAASKMPPLSPERLSLEVGRRIYVRDCASCHGADGRADVDAARILNPPPRNLVDPIGMARLDDGRVYLAIHRGRPGTAMGGWGELLAPIEIIDVMRYIRTLVGPLPAGMTPGQLDVKVGEEIYRQNCIECHGDKGNGDTSVGRQLSPHPRDFTNATQMASISDDALAQSITHGVAGTAMPSWDGVLNKEDVRRVLLYVHRTFTSTR